MCHDFHEPSRLSRRLFLSVHVTTSHVCWPLPWSGFRDIAKFLGGNQKGHNRKNRAKARIVIQVHVVGKFFVYICSNVVGISKVVGTVKSENGQACTSGT